MNDFINIFTHYSLSIVILGWWSESDKSIGYNNALRKSIFFFHNFYIPTIEYFITSTFPDIKEFFGGGQDLANVKWSESEVESYVHNACAVIYIVSDSTHIHMYV